MSFLKRGRYLVGILLYAFTLHRIDMTIFIVLILLL